MAAAMKKCKECTAEIPVEAKRCMHCGSATNRGFGLGQVIGAIVILFVAGALIFGFFGGCRSTRLSERELDRCVAAAIEGDRKPSYCP